jgi:hypothetical protein
MHQSHCGSIHLELRAPAKPSRVAELLRSFSATQLVFRCGGCTAGTSGSPLLAHVDAATGLGTVIGVIGGHQHGGVTDAISYAAALRPHIALYQAAITGS